MTTEKRRPPSAGIGRRKGVPNKMTVEAKAAFEYAFAEVGGAEGLAAWAKDNLTMFYRLFARLIPLSVNVDTTTRILTYAEECERERAAATDAAGDPGPAPPTTLQ